MSLTRIDEIKQHVKQLDAELEVVMAEFQAAWSLPRTRMAPEERARETDVIWDTRETNRVRIQSEVHLLRKEWTQIRIAELEQQIDPASKAELLRYRSIGEKLYGIPVDSAKEQRP